MTTISNIYDKMLSSGKSDYDRVGWGSLDSQKERFRILTEVGDLSKHSVLDVGCGLGGYFDYVRNIYPDILYTGTDINANMIEGAKQRHPGIEFVCTDITTGLSEISQRRFDYVFLSGALNLSADKHEIAIKNITETMFSLANKGVAINFLSIFSDYLSPGEYYCNPEVILKLAFSITKKVVLRHDYMPHDFTIYLYK